MIKNKFYIDNEELLKKLEGLTYKEIYKQSKTDTNNEYHYFWVISLALGLEMVDQCVDKKVIYVRGDGGVDISFDKFSLDLNEYELTYFVKRFSNAKEAIKEDVIIGDGSEFFFKWPIECLSYLKERFDVNNDLED